MSGYKYTALNFDDDGDGPSTSTAGNNQSENNFEEILFKQKVWKQFVGLLNLTSLNY